MPHKLDKKNLPRHLDRRVKLTDEQREEIRKSSESQRVLAARFGVSRRLIGFVKNPEKRLENFERRKDRGGWKLYYDKDSHNKAIKNTREHKKKHKEDLIDPEK
jgi:hypothetical protein